MFMVLYWTPMIGVSSYNPLPNHTDGMFSEDIREH